MLLVTGVCIIAFNGQSAANRKQREECRLFPPAPPCIDNSPEQCSPKIHTDTPAWCSQPIYWTPELLMIDPKLCRSIVMTVTLHIPHISLLSPSIFLILPLSRGSASCNGDVSKLLAALADLPRHGGSNVSLNQQSTACSFSLNEVTEAEEMKRL